MTDMTLGVPLEGRVPLGCIDELLAFRAPYLEERLVKEHVTRTREEAVELFDEAKRYLAIASLDEGWRVPMLSARVDEAWHQFALYTRPYAAFCDRFFGRFVPHAPAVQDGGAAADMPDRQTAYERFVVSYERLFGPLPAVWDDARSIALDTRLVRATFRRPLFARASGPDAELAIERVPPVVLARASRRALPALAFVADVGVFYARELPSLDDGERLTVVRALVGANVLRVAP